MHGGQLPFARGSAAASRHAFAGRVTRLGGLHASQALLGHASIQTTEGYLTKPSPDELAEAMARVTAAAGDSPSVTTERSARAASRS
jgi:integrase